MTKEILKQQLANDVFSEQRHAESRSRDMGFGGVVHAYSIDGQAYYIPAATHQDYMDHYGVEVDEPDDYIERAIRAMVEAILQKSVEGKILKTDEEQRIVYGWASVITEKGEPVVDRQGDLIEAETLVKAVNEFMEHVRVGKEMHEGEPVGKVIHSLPLTKEIGESLGIHADREGWVVAYKVYDDAVWDRVKSGELAAFSIGGRAVREKIE